MEIIIKIVVALVIMLICGGIAKAIIDSKGYPEDENHGFAWGFWLTIIGIIICSLKPDYNKPTSATSYSSSSSSRSHPSQNNRPSSSSTYRASSPQSQSSRTITKQNFRTKLDTLYDKSDSVSYVSSEHRQRVSTTRKVAKEVKRSFHSLDGRQEITLDMSWSSDLADLIEATEIVYTNAEMNCKSRLSSERFAYYINLHYRSFTAADLCHAKLQELYKAKKELGGLLYKLNDKTNPLRVSKSDYSQLSQALNAVKELISYLEMRRDNLNIQTGLIRDKIKVECGSRGEKWYYDLMERAQK